MAAADRIETFFVPVAGFGETFFPKQAAKVRPVHAIRVRVWEEITSNPYTFGKIAEFSDLRALRLNLRGANDEHFLLNAPLTMFYSGTLGVGPVKPLRRLARLPLDPQKCSFISSNGAAMTVCLEFHF